MEETQQTENVGTAMARHRWAKATPEERAATGQRLAAARARAARRRKRLAAGTDQAQASKGKRRK